MKEEASGQHIFVRSHVARDLLQSAGLFKTDKLVVWEYVSNGLEYVDPGVAAVVRVALDSKRRRITVSDNGRGMDWEGLQNFFIMHGENVDRKSNRPGRGRFGTGKSAAFGIANTLRLTTVRNGTRSRVELSREDIEGMGSEAPVPVRVLERGVKSPEENGTVVEIENVHLRSLDQAGVIRFVERHLARWPKNVTVLVNNHECEFAEPSVAQERLFKPSDEEKASLGGIELMVKIAKEALDEDLRGVSIYSKGIWYETTLAGSEGREMAQYLFGEVEVPALDDDRSPISPFDMSRSMRLNPSNELVQRLFAFIGRSVEEVRRELVSVERGRRASEEAKRLAEQAALIAQVINEDFETFKARLAQAKAKAPGSVDAGAAAAEGGTEEDDLLFGTVRPAVVITPKGDFGRGDGTQRYGRIPPDLGPKVVPGPPDAPDQGRPAGGEGRVRKTKGGFQVRFDRMGTEGYRAKYVRDERTIYINLDHPQLVAAKGGGSTDDLGFRRLSYEVAFAEYAVALASELAARDEYLDPSDPIVDIRETLNRLARKGAVLYTAK